MRKILGRDAEGRVVTIEIVTEEGPIGDGGGGGEHPNLATPNRWGLPLTLNSPPMQPQRTARSRTPSAESVTQARSTTRHSAQ